MPHFFSPRLLYQNTQKIQQNSLSYYEKSCFRSKTFCFNVPASKCFRSTCDSCPFYVNLLPTWYSLSLISKSWFLHIMNKEAHINRPMFYFRWITNKLSHRVGWAILYHKHLWGILIHGKQKKTVDITTYITTTGYILRCWFSHCHQQVWKDRSLLINERSDRPWSSRNTTRWSKLGIVPGVREKDDTELCDRRWPPTNVSHLG